MVVVDLNTNMQSIEKTYRPRGSVSLYKRGLYLYILFPRSLFGGKLKKLALGLTDTAQNRAIADQKIRAIQTDIDLGNFDPTLERYQQQAKKAEYLKLVESIYPETNLLELWDKYTGYRAGLIKESTLENYVRVKRHLEKSKVVSPENALAVRTYLFENTTILEAHRTIIQINAAYKWGSKHKLVKSPNPYEGMASELNELLEDRPPEPNSFLPEQKQAILEAFANHCGNRSARGNATCGIGYNYYLSFVQFLFLTGCRPSEAVGLLWKDVSPELHKITFSHSIYNAGSGKMIKSKKSKTNRIRTFPCNAELQELLSTLKKSSPDSLVFPSPRNKAIGYNNFSQRAWDKLVNPIKAGTTPYSCRDTFITEQIAKGIPIAIVAKWVDNSVEVIEKHYLDLDNLEHIKPL